MVGVCNTHWTMCIFFWSCYGKTTSTITSKCGLNLVGVHTLKRWHKTDAIHTVSIVETVTRHSFIVSLKNSCHFLLDKWVSILWSVNTDFKNIPSAAGGLLHKLFIFLIHGFSRVPFIFLYFTNCLSQYNLLIALFLLYFISGNILTILITSDQHFLSLKSKTIVSDLFFADSLLNQHFIISFFFYLF